MEQQDIERIEAYLLGQMSPELRQAFEAELQANASLAQALKEHGALVQGVQEHLFRDMLEEIHQETHLSQNSSRRLFKIRPIWGIAAAVLLLFGALWFWWPNSPPAYLASINPIETDPGLPTVLGSTTALEFAEGMNAYKLHQYAEARAYWQALFEAAPQNDTLLFFLAQIDLAEEQTPAAMAKLERISQWEESVFLDKSLWYLALAKLKTGQIEAAEVLLTQLSIKQGYKSEQAKSLLRSLP